MFKKWQDVIFSINESNVEMNEMICLNSKLENLKLKTRNIYNIVLMSQR